MKAAQPYHSVDLTAEPLSTITPKLVLEKAVEYHRIVMTQRQVTELRRRVYDDMGPSAVRFNEHPPEGARPPRGAVGAVLGAWIVERAA